MSHAEPFTLRLFFSGICLFTPARQGHPLDDGIVVLLPGANWYPQKKCADGSDLVQHLAKLRFRLKNVYGARAVPELTVRWPLNRRRLELRVREAPGACNRLCIARGSDDGSFDFVPNLRKIAPNYADIDPQDLTASPTSDIQAQVLIDKGRIYTNASPDVWTFPKSDITPSEITQRMAYEIVVELRGLLKAELLIASCGYYDIEKLRLAPARHEEPVVEVSIVNFEPDGVTKPSAAEAKVDVDFKWYFELVTPVERQQLVDLKKDLPAPVPPAHFVENAKGRRYPFDLATGRDCFSGQSS